MELSAMIFFIPWQRMVPATRKLRGLAEPQASPDYVNYEILLVWSILVSNLARIWGIPSFWHLGLSWGEDGPKTPPRGLRGPTLDDLGPQLDGFWHELCGFGLDFGAILIISASRLQKVQAAVLRPVVVFDIYIHTYIHVPKCYYLIGLGAYLPKCYNWLIF